MVPKGIGRVSSIASWAGKTRVEELVLFFNFPLALIAVTWRALLFAEQQIEFPRQQMSFHESVQWEGSSGTG